MNDQLGGFFNGLNGPLGHAISASFGTKNTDNDLTVQGALITSDGDTFVTDGGDRIIYVQ
jgi:hypothetical protein